MDGEIVQRRRTRRALLWMVLMIGLLWILSVGMLQAQSSTPAVPPTPTDTVTATQITTTALVRYNATLRAGPGGRYRIVDRIDAGETITTVATSASGAWLQLLDGTWIPKVMVKVTEAISMPTSRVTIPPTPSRRLIATATPVTATTTLTLVEGSTDTVSQTLTVSRPVTISVPNLPQATQRITPTAPVVAVALRNANLRAGPGTNYVVVGGVVADEALAVQGSNGDSTWYRLRDGSWIAAFLIEYRGEVLPTVVPTIIAGIPTAEPTATPTLPAAPVATPVTSPDAPVATEAAPTMTVPPSSGNSSFVVIERRLWNPWENGGSTDGPSVHCGQGRNLVVNVLDEFGGRLNNVAVQAEYGAKEIHVTGAQGKGDGVVEFVLGGGQDIRVIRDADGTPVEGEYARGLSTDPRGIDQPSLQQAGYCQDDESCRTFANNLSCIGHFSWTVTFQRRR